MRGFRPSLFVGLAVLLVSGIAPHALATFPGENGEIAIGHWRSSDGSSIRTIQPDGSRGRLLSPAGEFALAMDWSPDGATIALAILRGRPRIVIADVASGERDLVIRIEDTPVGDSPHSVTFSPGGERLVFCVSYAFGERYKLYTVGVDGSGLTDISADHSDCGADWSTDDRIVAVAHEPVEGAARRIVTMDPDGTDRVKVIPVRAVEGTAINPSWSPDGSRLVYAAEIDGGRADVFSIEGDGNAEMQLTDSPRRSEGAPVYSPDATTIVFARTRGRYVFSSTRPLDLFSLWADGTHLRRLTSTELAREWPLSWQPTPPP
jgi:Tol biopolymer transport system component